MNMSVERQGVANQTNYDPILFLENGVMVWLICDSLPFYVHVHICSPSHTDEEYKTNVDSETVGLRLLIKGLIVPVRLWILSYSLTLLLFFFKAKQRQKLSRQSVG